jgi:hypothetical protein
MTAGGGRWPLVVVLLVWLMMMGLLLVSGLGLQLNYNFYSHIPFPRLFVYLCTTLYFCNFN